MYATICLGEDIRCMGCTDRSAFEQMINLKKDAIKTDILRKLGFSSAPNVSGEYLSNLSFIQKHIREVGKMYFAFENKPKHLIIANETEKIR